MYIEKRIDRQTDTVAFLLSGEYNIMKENFAINSILLVYIIYLSHFCVLIQNENVLQ